MFDTASLNSWTISRACQQILVSICFRREAAPEINWCFLSVSIKCYLSGEGLLLNSKLTPEGFVCLLVTLICLKTSSKWSSQLPCLLPQSAGSDARPHRFESWIHHFLVMRVGENCFTWCIGFDLKFSNQKIKGDLQQSRWNRMGKVQVKLILFTFMLVWNFYN